MDQWRRRMLQQSDGEGEVALSDKEYVIRRSERNRGGSSPVCRLGRRFPAYSLRTMIKGQRGSSIFGLFFLLKTSLCGRERSFKRHFLALGHGRRRKDNTVK